MAVGDVPQWQPYGNYPRKTCAKRSCLKSFGTVLIYFLPIVTNELSTNFRPSCRLPVLHSKVSHPVRAVIHGIRASPQRTWMTAPWLPPEVACATVASVLPSAPQEVACVLISVAGDQRNIVRKWKPLEMHSRLDYRKACQFCPFTASTFCLSLG